MKIFFLVDVFPSVSETFILAQITALLDRGHDVRVFAAARPARGQTFPSDIDRYQLMDRVVYHHDRPSSWGQRLTGLPALWRQADQAGRWILWRALNVFCYGREALSLNGVYQAALFLKEGMPDIWQAHFGPNGVLGVHLKALGFSGRVVTMFHGYDIRAGMKDGGRGYRSLAVTGDIALAICQYNRQHLERWGFPTRTILNLSCGVDIRRFAQRQQVSGKKVRHVVVIARLVKEKGLDLMLEAAADLKDLSVIVDIIGSGPLEQALRQQIARLGLTERVVLHGARTPEEVAALLAAGDVYCSTSREEALPVSIMEAMASGLPVVATDVGGVWELVANGHSGILVPSGNKEKVVEALRRLLNDEMLCQEYGSFGRRIIENYFDNRVLVERLEKIYECMVWGVL